MIPRARAPKLGDAPAAKLVIRAEKLKLMPASSHDDTAIMIPATVEAVDYQGQAARYFLRVGDHALQAINMIDTVPFAAGDSVTLRLLPRDCAALPAT